MAPPFSSDETGVAARIWSWGGGRAKAINLTTEPVLCPNIRIDDPDMHRLI